MPEVAIRVRGLGKRYKLGELQRYKALRDVLADGLKAPFRRLKGLFRNTSAKQDSGYLWALKDVNFEVQEGEVLGVIGANGAGKSTLLKLLSRITDPTAGEAIIRGRVGSLLEVGTGFHPELTGRENVFLNGAILGMRKREIERKFDAIVSFAEVERFIDTPIKHYSSGMYVRLAFAVAAHLEPEILLVDEVLAVGDAAFQRKCLGRMDRIGREGRTVLFVSHNMGAIQQLTQRTIVLESGKIAFDGETAEAVRRYLAHGVSQEEVRDIPTNLDYVRVSRFGVESEGRFDSPLTFYLNLVAKRPLREVSIGLAIHNSGGVRLFTVRNTVPRINVGESTLKINIPNPHSPPGNYSCTLGLDIAGVNAVFAEYLMNFEISDVGCDDPFLVGRRDRIGLFLPSTCQVTRTQHLAECATDTSRPS